MPPRYFFLYLFIKWTFLSIFVKRKTTFIVSNLKSKIHGPSNSGQSFKNRFFPTFNGTTRLIFPFPRFDSTSFLLPSIDAGKGLSSTPVVAHTPPLQDSLRALTGDFSFGVVASDPTGVDSRPYGRSGLPGSRRTRHTRLSRGMTRPNLTLSSRSGSSDLHKQPVVA